MAANVKVAENMTKNMTIAERQAREAAEKETLPERTMVTLRAPAYINRDPCAKRYWIETIKRMEGITLLDDLDTEILAIYCSMLSRRDELNDLCRKLLRQAAKSKLSAQEHMEEIDKLGDLMIKVQNHDRTILSYAEKLGLTPSGRVRLARKRAEVRMISADDDLFG